jgi:prophage DNA circulation protein
MSLTFKEYTWPNDPDTYREVLSREPQYVTTDGVTTYTGMSATGRVITGTGAFFGTTACAKFRELMELAEENSPGDLVHPVWGTRRCYLTKLELTQEPREDFVSYRIEFMQARSDGTIPK